MPTLMMRGMVNLSLLTWKRLPREETRSMRQAPPTRSSHPSGNASCDERLRTYSGSISLSHLHHSLKRRRKPLGGTLLGTRGSTSKNRPKLTREMAVPDLHAMSQTPVEPGLMGEAMSHRQTF